MAGAGNLVFRVDASPRMGSGHLMRCRALAQAWETRGGKSIFVMAQGELGQASRQWKFRRMKVQPGSHEDALKFFDMIQKIPQAKLVLDGYHFTSDYQRRLKDSGHPLLVIDDLGNVSPYSADFVLNQNQENGEKLYRDKRPETSLLMGPSFFLLRREFLKERKASRKARVKASRVLVSLGSADPPNVTQKVLQGLRHVRKPLDIVVVAGRQNLHVKALAEYIKQTSLNARLLIDVKDLAPLMAWADLAVSAGGVTCWEMVFMGLPCIGILLAENQRASLEVLEQRKAVMNLGRHKNVTPHRITQTVARLLDSPKTRQSMTNHGQKVLDGRGADRVLDRFLGRTI